MLQPRSVLSRAGRSRGSYLARSAAVTRPPRAAMSRGDLLGEVAGVEVGPPPVRQVGERVGELGRAERRTGGVGHALGAVEGAGLLVPAEDRVVHQGQVAGGRRAEREAVARGGDRRGQQLGPGGGAVAFVGASEGGEGPRRGDRAVAGEHGEPAAVRRVDLAHAGAEPLPRQAPAGHLHVAVDHDGRAVGRPDVDERAPERADDAGLGDRRHEHGGDRGVDRRAAGVDEVQARLGGEGTGCGHCRAPVHGSIVDHRRASRPGASPCRTGRSVGRRGLRAVQPAGLRVGARAEPAGSPVGGG